MSRILICGLGMMAGAWVRCLNRAEHTLIGYDVDPVVRQAALAEKWVDSVIATFPEEKVTVDVIVLAMPVDGIITTLHTLQHLHVPATTLVTDIGSVKQPVMAAAEPLIAQGVPFVGGHPMVGSEHNGWQASSLVELSNQPYFTVASAETAPAVARLQALLQAKPKFVAISAAAHDALMAQLSHAPHVVASALVNATRLPPQQLQLAAGGFRDTTRIAMADPLVWAAICTTNKTAIAAQVQMVQTELAQFQALLALDEPQQLAAWFKQAQTRRQELEEC
ncbi:prephenate dehydrogenase [Lacticaseibacillus baoqingensis]|uniref:Prephenate dehydrogenase n=1 Tax=Lacticaseibacillus baoqingensis TaxID=2486013 RepID=A0ABW4E321_9LACO|nr:prephenate dehydrogenase/arogenate dehydrogenase family protein [Lacticaseibacillus baoqingensis]